MLYVGLNYTFCMHYLPDQIKVIKVKTANVFFKSLKCSIGIIYLDVKLYIFIFIRMKHNRLFCLIFQD